MLKLAAGFLMVLLLATSAALPSCNGANPPQVYSITPSVGTAVGGTKVTITGASLGCVSVLFGSTLAYSVTASSSTVTVTSPPGSQGTTLVTIRNPNAGVFANAASFAYFAYANTSGPPTEVTIVPADASLAISFSAPTNDGGSSVIDYEYSLNNGTSWIRVGSTTSPIIVGGLTNGTAYGVSLRAITSVGPGSASIEKRATPFTVPGPPSDLVVEAGDGSLTIHYVPPTNDGGSAVTGYEYSLDGGSAWSEAGTTKNPIFIGGLINGTAYSVVLRAENAAGPGQFSEMVEATPVTTPGAPVELVATPGDGYLKIGFKVPANDGGSSISDYEYSIDGGQSWHSSGASTSPVFIGGLANGDSYSVSLRAVNTVGPGPSSDSISSTPYTFPDVATDLAAVPLDGGLVVTFDAPASNGGTPIIDFEYSLNGGVDWISAGTAFSPIQIGGLENGETYTVSIRAVNAAGPGPVSTTVTGTTPSPISHFDAVKTSVDAVISQQAIEDLRGSISAISSIVKDARDRLTANTGQDDLSFTAGLALSGVETEFDASLSRFVEYLDMQVTYSGHFVTFDPAKGGSHMDLGVQSEVNPKHGLIIGNFIRAGFDADIIDGEFAGKHRQLDLVTGGYAVGLLRNDIVLDAFLSVGLGRNNLRVTDSTLALRSSYLTSTVTFGTSLTGHLKGNGFDLWPELSYSFGRTYIGTVGLTGTAYGIVDPELSLGAGSVNLGTILLRPEIRVPIDESPSADGATVAIFAPRLSCEGAVALPTGKMCGLGGEVGVEALFSGGRRSLSVNIDSSAFVGGGKPSIALSFTSTF